MPFALPALTEDQLKDVIVDEVRSVRILQQLECLSVIHGALLLVNLGIIRTD